MFQNMFDRLLALFIVVILVITIAGGYMSVATARNTMVENRMEALLKQAREIAFLAGQMQSSSFSTLFWRDGSMNKYLQYKAEEVYTEYNAYILIVDRNGRVLDNMNVLSSTGADTLETLQTEDITDTLRTVLSGEEVTATIKSSSKPIFTVAVPLPRGGKVEGAVFIHTASQIIESEYRSFLLQVIIGFALAAIVGMVGTAIYTKGVTKPLTEITHAAEAMSLGNLSTRAKITGVAEVRQLAGSFNVMAEQLESNEESRKEFVANVSHELRSPVTSIHGFVEGILDGTIPMEESHSYLQIVYDETNRMKRLITDLLQLSRMDKGVEKLNMSEFDINELLRRVIIERMADLEKKEIEPEMDFCEEKTIVVADADRIAQVVHNIVDNALKYLSLQGHLFLKTEVCNDTTLSVTIENDGEPISAEDREHIFERFYKAEKAHTAGQGTGLGLSICKQIMELHGQILECTVPENGAGFRFTLQLSAQNSVLPKLNPAKF